MGKTKIYKLFFDRSKTIKKCIQIASTKRSMQLKRNTSVREYGSVCLLSYKSQAGLHMAKVNATSPEEAISILEESLED